VPSRRETSPYASPLLTVGYGSSTLDVFLALLAREEVAYLIDVRSKPYSRYKPEFNREALAARLAEAGVRYVFMGDLLGGLPDDPACYTDGKVDYEKVRARPFHQQGVERLRTAQAQGLGVALMCACGKPEKCHRSKLIGVSLQRAGIPVVHLDQQGRRLDQEAVMMRLNASPDLFGFMREAATSRKRYTTDDDE
jgi:uncharacterized protein (DUF488 family)